MKLFLSVKNFLLFSSGVNRNVVSNMSNENISSEENKYAAIGASIILTATVASLSGGYALYSIFNSSIISGLLGSLWGIKIFNLDRFVILSSRKKQGNLLADIKVAVPRIAMAFALGFVISKPIEIKIFENRIIQSISDENAQKSADIFKFKIAEIKRINKEQVNEKASLQKSGSLESVIKNSDNSYDEQRKQLDEEVKKQLQPFNGESKVGLIEKIEVLEKLKKGNPTIEYTNLFITALFIMIDSVPIILKLLAKYSPYDAYIEMEEESAIYSEQEKLLDINRKSNELKNLQTIHKMSDGILSITMKKAKPQELSDLVKYNLEELKSVNIESPNLKDIRNEALQISLQITKERALKILTNNPENNLESNNAVKVPVMETGNQNGQQPNPNN